MKRKDINAKPKKNILFTLQQFVLYFRLRFLYDQISRLRFKADQFSWL
jgi:hypothetical protein